jgi:hypothetical protein
LLSNTRRTHIKTYCLFQVCFGQRPPSHGSRCAHTKTNSIFPNFLIAGPWPSKTVKQKADESEPARIGTGKCSLEDRCPLSSCTRGRAL